MNDFGNLGRVQIISKQLLEYSGLLDDIENSFSDSKMCNYNAAWVPNLLAAHDTLLLSELSDCLLEGILLLITI